MKGRGAPESVCWARLVIIWRSDTVNCRNSFKLIWKQALLRNLNWITYGSPGHPALQLFKIVLSACAWSLNWNVADTSLLFAHLLSSLPCLWSDARYRAGYYLPGAHFLVPTHCHCSRSAFDGTGRVAALILMMCLVKEIEWRVELGKDKQTSTICRSETENAGTLERQPK